MHFFLGALRVNSAIMLLHKLAADDVFDAFSDKQTTGECTLFESVILLYTLTADDCCFYVRCLKVKAFLKTL